MLIFIFLPVVLALFAVMCLVVVLMLWLLQKAGGLRRTWQFVALCPALLIAIPVWSYWQDRLREAECHRLTPGDLSCGGELGGLFLDLTKLGLIVAGLMFGPLLGYRLAC